MKGMEYKIPPPEIELMENFKKLKEICIEVLIFKKKNNNKMWQWMFYKWQNCYV